MAVLPPDSLFRFHVDAGALQCLCFMDTSHERIPMEQGEVAGATIPAASHKILMAAGENGIVYFWDLERNRLKFKQKLGEQIVSLHYYNSEVIVQEKSGLITIYVPKKDHEHEYERVTSLPCALGFCKVVHMWEKLLIPQEDASIQVFDLPTRTTIKTMRFTPCHTLATQSEICQTHNELKRADIGAMMCLEHADIAKRHVIFAGFETGDIFGWNYETGEQITHAKFNEQMISMSIDGTGMRGVCGGTGGALQVFTLDKNVQFTLQCEVALTNDGCEIVKIRHDKKIFVCGGTDGRLRVYSWKTLRMLVVLEENHARISDVQFSTDQIENWGGRIMAVSGADCNISFWNLYN